MRTVFAPRVFHHIWNGGQKGGGGGRRGEHCSGMQLFGLTLSLERTQQREESFLSIHLRCWTSSNSWRLSGFFLPRLLSEEYRLQGRRRRGKIQAGNFLIRPRRGERLTSCKLRDSIWISILPCCFALIFPEKASSGQALFLSFQRELMIGEHNVYNGLTAEKEKEGGEKRKRQELKGNRKRRFIPQCKDRA